MEYIEDSSVGRITFPITTNDNGWILQCGTTDSLEYFDFAITKTGKLEPWGGIRFRDKWGLTWFDNIETHEELSSRIEETKNNGWDFIEFEEIYRMLCDKFGGTTGLRQKVEEMFREINDKRYPKDSMSVDELLFG